MLVVTRFNPLMSFWLHLKHLELLTTEIPHEEKKNGKNLHKTDFHVGPGSRFSIRITSDLKVLSQ